MNSNDMLLLSLPNTSEMSLLSHSLFLPIIIIFFAIETVFMVVNFIGDSCVCIEYINWIQGLLQIPLVWMDFYLFIGMKETCMEFCEWRCDCCHLKDR